MQRSKVFVNILLFAVFVLVVKCSSTNRLQNNTAWLRKYLKEIEEKQHHETSKINPTPPLFEESTNSLVLSSEAERQKLENNKQRLHSNPVGVAPKEHHINNGIKPHRTSNPFSKTQEKNYPGKQRWNIVNGNKHVKQTSPRSDILNRKLSKDEANFREFSNPGKEINKKVSNHRIAKRNVYFNETKQARITASTFITPPACTGKRSCSGRCTENITEWGTDESFTCYCDTACYEIFNDCCSDYTKYCGEQKRSNISIKKFKWTCEPLGNFRLTISRTRKCEIGEGLWMVSHCADDWPYDKVQRKCEKPAKFIREASDIKRYIPAVSENVTFRNYFCARCNRIVGPFEYFPVEIKTNIISPETYSFRKKLNFLLSYGAKFPQNGLLRPKPYQKRRYCLKSVIDSCPGNITSEPCTNGSVELISGRKSFKNYNCALCNDPNGQYTCFPSFSPSDCRGFSSSQKFLLNLNYRNVYYPNRSPLSVLNTLCRSKGLEFDVKLQECVRYIPPPSGNEGRIRVLAWFAPSKDFQFTEDDFKTGMKQYFGVEHSQIYHVSTKQTYSSLSSTILFHLVRSTLILTPEQIFDILFETDSKSSRLLNLRSFIRFVKPFSLTFKNITYTIIKTTSRPLSCNTRFNGTGLFKNVYGNKKMCEEYHSRLCNTTQTGLTKKDFAITSELSLYHRDTRKVYKFGQYVVLINKSITLCNFDQSTSDVPTCSSENSCKGRCSNQTEWRTEIKLRCSCDPDCYEVFNDCCSDYTKYCGAQKPTETPTKKYNYSCEGIGHRDGSFNNFCTVSHGLWTVTRCPASSPHDISRAKCEAPLDNLDISFPDVYAYLPVLGHDNTTFRNMYCAICNGVRKFELWPLYTSTSASPPEHFNLTEKIHFLLHHGAKFIFWNPGKNQARRYCMRDDIVESCPPFKKFQLCTNGDVSYKKHIKNAHCVLCQRSPIVCFPIPQMKCSMNRVPSFSLVLYQKSEQSRNTKVKTKIKTVSKYERECNGSGLRLSCGEPYARSTECSGSGMIFPNDSPPEQNEQKLKRFYIHAWLEPPRNSQNISFTPTEFHESLVEYLNVSQLQLFDINITPALRRETITSFFYLVSSTIILTPQQSSKLLLANRNNNISTETKLLSYMYFLNPFTLHIKDIPYTVIKTTSRPLACVGKTTYTPEGYILQDQERVFIPSTNKTYEQFEYYWQNAEQLEVKRGNITVCQKYIPTKCNGSIVLYTTEEYRIMFNLSICLDKTSSLYNYGEYEILSNKSVAICRYHKVDIITETRQTVRDNEALGYITFISFLLSILFLIFLLVTYILFPQLRTLPGKNLMNFATTLLLFQITWLPLKMNEIRSNKPVCMAMGIIEHYFLMASFVSMSVISFHTCKIFARSVPAPKVWDGDEKKLFCLYLALVWLLPGIFVGICVALDHQDVVKIGYGESEICWLTEDNAYTYFVIIPIGVLLLFNIIAFVIAAIYLRKHGQNTAARQAIGNRRSNFLIYVKLSTLMGFTWLFGLLACRTIHNRILVFLRGFYLVARCICCSGLCYEC